MNIAIKAVGGILLIVCLFVIINIIIIQNWRNTSLPRPQYVGEPALIYTCLISNENALFERVQYSDGSIPVAYSQGDKVPTISNLDMGDTADGMLVVIDKKLLKSGPVVNRIVNEYFIRDGYIDGLGYITVEAALERMGIKSIRRNVKQP